MTTPILPLRSGPHFTTLIFRGAAAWTDAETWLGDRGFALGPVDAHQPRRAIFHRPCIFGRLVSWSGLRPEAIIEIAGRATDRRDHVEVEIFPDAEAEAVAAALDRDIIVRVAA